MQESSRYAVGLDIGTSYVRAVVGHLDGTDQKPTIIGVSSEPNNGMRKGTVVNLVNTAQAVDKALEAAERMSGHQINEATISVNGNHVVGMSSQGVIAVGHEITEDDLLRVEEAATVVQLPANREILEVTPRSYQLDGQENIKDPIGMTGVRLEVDAHVITALGPHLKNLAKVCEMTETHVNQRVLAGLAASRAVVTEQQTENGVVVIDLGGTTTNVVVFEEGDLQHVAVLPVGSVNVTNDLAIGLKTDLDIAEKVKIDHAVAVPTAHKNNSKKAVVKADKVTHEFELEEIDMIVDARLEEIFELVQKELHSIGRASKLPGGVVLTGGGALMPGIDEYAKQALQLSARVGRPSGYGGMADQIDSPAYATAVGLMLLDLQGGASGSQQGGGKSGKGSGIGDNIGSLTGKITGIFGKFRS
ncbi:TPA: cell division protein FtsA [Candidatus Saccharibacteria bacterium]|nr:cell division protein FtsA [Candidatus Saccharibacteria bacterium]HRK41291.1 cell division protein FtsA [Candidatus Saccharibacteria bacterium]